MEIFHKIKKIYSYIIDFKNFEKDSFFYSLVLSYEDQGTLEGQKLMPMVIEALDFASKNIIEEKIKMLSIKDLNDKEEKKLRDMPYYRKN